jgi:hypothetical protein
MKEKLICYVDREFINGKPGKRKWLLHDGSATVSLTKNWRGGERVIVTVQRKERE